MQVLTRRLFESIDRSRVHEVVRACQEIWSRTAEALPPVGQSDDRAANLSSRLCAGDQPGDDSVT